MMNQIISDPAFRTLGDANSLWKLCCHEGVQISPRVHGAVLTLDISNTQAANWHGELRYAPFEVASSHKYTVVFSARAKHAFTFSVWLGRMRAPHASIVPEENHFGEKRMTAAWQSFSHTWTPNATEPLARLNFVLGQIDNVVEIKSIRLTCRPNGAAGAKG